MGGMENEMTMSCDCALTLCGVAINYGNRRLLENADAVFPPGSLTALVGRNGAGKSTLLRAITGLRRFDAGLAAINTKDISKIPASELAKLVSLVTTEKMRIPHMTCHEVVQAGRAPYTDWRGKLSNQDLQKVSLSLARVGMEAFSDRPISQLSDGERQKIMIARALAQDTPVILLDEPTSFLDFPGRWEIVRLLKELAETEGKCILYSTHELDIALELTHRIALLDDAILTVDTPEGFKGNGILERVFKWKQND